MTPRRFVPRALAAAVALVALAGCADTLSPTAPSPAASRALASSPSFNIAGPKVGFVMVGDTAVGRFVVQPNVGHTFVFGMKHAISFPARAICDRATSGYGPTEWDKPCAPTTKAVTVSVKAYRTAGGSVRVDFQPAVRFNPATNGVFLYLEDNNSTISPWFKQIYYCTTTGACIDESLTDPSLTTFYNATTKLHARRLKHFSGYVVGVGRSEEGLN